MEILGIGPLELFFILIIALIVLGPNDMVKAGRTMGRFLRRLVTSPTWQVIQQTSRDLRYLPNKLIRDAGMEEELEDMKQISRDMSAGKETEMLRSLRNPLGAASDEIKKATSVPPQDFSAWTTPPAAPTPENVPPLAPPEATGAEAASAPAATNPPGAAELFSPTPESNPPQPPTDPNPS